MRRIAIILNLIIIISILLSGCNRINQGSIGVELKPSATVQPITKTDNANTQYPTPKATSQIINDDKNDLNTSIATLNDNIKNINNKALSHDERIQVTTKLIENLTKLLENIESSKLSDEELQKALDYNIVVKSKAQSLDGITYNVRIVRYDGLPELFGTLERKWSLIQWWDDKKTNVQTIINKGNEVTTDFLIWKVNGVPTVALAGYLTMNKPYPVFISTWQLKSSWEKTNLFSNNIDSNNIWNITLSDNMSKIESKKKDEITVETNQQKNGFIVYSKLDQTNKIEFELQNGKIISK